jgi:low affinity Fe/Cu permease
MKIRDWFSDISRKAAHIAGSWQAFIAASFIVILWLIGGFYFGFLDPVYQLVINTFTTCITFIMVFLIQSAQNRDQAAVQIKLNELLSSINKANDQLIDIENATDEQLEQARQDICANKSQLPESSNEGDGP